MTSVEILGYMAAVASLSISILGLPSQIRKNYQTKTCSGLSTNLIFSAFISYGLWSAYGWLKPDMFLAIAQTVGFTCAFILVFQYFYYRKHKSKHK